MEVGAISSFDSFEIRAEIAQSLASVRNVKRERRGKYLGMGMISGALLNAV